MQREHYLREQIKAIKTELGDNDGADDLDQYRTKLAELNLSEESNKEISRQIKRLEKMHQDSSEANIIRNFIETALALPWNTYTEDKLDLGESQTILDEEHYGLDDIKDRILEYLAVKKLNKEAKSPIICFVGPPGVGKTSLGKSIAKSLGRNFVRIALGGVRDEADIRGHRRTYVGAMPGRIVTAIKNAESMNPVIMLDELDKLGSDHRGDPSSALLEVLDPEQNNSFVDHYLGVPMDLSKVMFIANANTLSTIPAPLRDRLELIEVSGYTEEEKVAIANQYLIPKQIKEAGLDSIGVDFSMDSVSTIINGYTRESGLRKLEQQIASVCRKVARKYAELDEKGQEKGNFDLTRDEIISHLGAEKFGDNFYHKEAAVGVSLGLAYTQFGGEVLAIESTLVPTGSFKLVLTGKLGEVMKESAQAALSFVRASANQFGFDPAVLDKNELHIHFPAGAVPKDGPSAGVAIASAILSALLDEAPTEKIAMTGEITIHGKVLPIGGVREKLLAAQREGMNLVLLPEKNKPQYEELPDSLKQNLDVRFVSEYYEAFCTLFPEVASVTGVANSFSENSVAS
jgi:ATP-dependent Lon protease